MPYCRKIIGFLCCSTTSLNQGKTVFLIMFMYLVSVGEAIFNQVPDLRRDLLVEATLPKSIRFVGYWLVGMNMHKGENSVILSFDA